MTAVPPASRDRNLNHFTCSSNSNPRELFGTCSELLDSRIKSPTFSIYVMVDSSCERSKRLSGTCSLSMSPLNQIHFFCIRKLTEYHINARGVYQTAMYFLGT